LGRPSLSSSPISASTTTARSRATTRHRGARRRHGCVHWATRLTRVVVCSFYLVVYEDGDKEEMEFQELTAWLKARPRLFIKALSGGSYPMPVRDAEPRTPSSLRQRHCRSAGAAAGLPCDRRHNGRCRRSPGHTSWATSAGNASLWLWEAQREGHGCRSRLGVLLRALGRRVEWPLPAVAGHEVP
jgi:hypothetical protein